MFTACLAFAENDETAYLKIQNLTTDSNLQFSLRDFTPRAGGDPTTLAGTFTIGDQDTFTSTSANIVIPSPNGDSWLLPSMTANGTPGEVSFSFNDNYDNNNLDYNDSTAIMYYDDFYSPYGWVDWATSYSNTTDSPTTTCAKQPSSEKGMGDCWAGFLKILGNDGDYGMSQLRDSGARLDVIIASGSSSVTFSVSGIYGYHTLNISSMDFLNGNNVLTSSDGQSLYVVCLSASYSDGTTETATDALARGPYGGTSWDNEAIGGQTITLSVNPLNSLNAGATQSTTGEIASSPCVASHNFTIE